MNRKWDPKVPVDENGNWLSYSYGHTQWQLVQPFWATVKIDGMRTGRSSKIIVLQNVKTGLTYPMFVIDLVHGLKDGSIFVKSDGRQGLITAKWTVSKRGQNYGIKAVKMSK